MPAYIVFIKEREHDAATMAAYSAKAGPSLAGHSAKPLAYYGAIETLEGPEAQGSVTMGAPEVFREAFSGVTPAQGRGPTGEEARQGTRLLFRYVGPVPPFNFVSLRAEWFGAPAQAA